MNKLKTLTIEFEQVLHNFREQSKEALLEVFKDFWEGNPEIESLCWTQYAPHFNDGDACVFSVNDIEISFFDTETDNMSRYETMDAWEFPESYTSPDRVIYMTNSTEEGLICCLN
jgi:hypothetical protein